MPTYEYEILDKSGEPTGERFEVFQKMSDEPLKKKPETGEPCRRAITAPNVAGKWSDMKGKSTLSNENLDRLGFTKYENKGGYLEKTAGKDGPMELHP